MTLVFDGRYARGGRPGDHDGRDRPDRRTRPRRWRRPCGLTSSSRTGSMPAAARSTRTTCAGRSCGSRSRRTAATIPCRQPVRRRPDGDAARDLRDGLPEPVPDPGRLRRRRVHHGLLARLHAPGAAARARGHGPRRDRAQAGQLRLAAVHGAEPADVRVGLQPDPDARTVQYDCDNPARARTTRRGTTPAWTATPPIIQPDLWYSFQDPTWGTPCLESYNTPTVNAVQEPVPGARQRRRRPARRGQYEYDPANPNPTKFPPYYDDSVFFGEFTRDTLKEIRLDEDNKI